MMEIVHALNMKQTRLTGGLNRKGKGFAHVYFHSTINRSPSLSLKHDEFQNWGVYHVIDEE